jgi:diguanylate cyclase (GGDEF)-like protein
MKNKVQKIISKFNWRDNKKHLKKEELIAELSRAYDELRVLYDSLEQANLQKSRLLEELQQKTTELQRQTREDSLTGLHNRRYLDDQLFHEFVRAQRYNRNLSVIMADLDHFKQVNDLYGHGIGDEVLKIVSQIFRDNCREVDFIARYGGEEFVLVLPETPSNGAILVCERIRQAVEDYDWDKLKPGLKVTLSLGIAYILKVESYKDMLHQADVKLYEAKKAGRNVVKY